MAKIETIHVAARIPKDLVRFMDARGKRTEVIIEALELLIGGGTKPQAVEHQPAKFNPLSIPGVFLGSQLGTHESETIEDHPERPMCGYEEYDPQTGETYACRLPAHGPKIKHQRGNVI